VSNDVRVTDQLDKVYGDLAVPEVARQVLVDTDW